VFLFLLFCVVFNTLPHLCPQNRPKTHIPPPIPPKNSKTTDGELRQPGHETMRRLAGAKEKLGLRVHGLVVGSPEKQRADPAVLRALCTSTLPNGKVEVLVSEFAGWASVQVRSGGLLLFLVPLLGGGRRQGNV
jgi:hypothetical protein